MRHSLQTDVLKQLSITPIILKKSLNAYNSPIGLQHTGSCSLSDIREALCNSNPKYFTKHMENKNL